MSNVVNLNNYRKHKEIQDSVRLCVEAANGSAENLNAQGTRLLNQNRLEEAKSLFSRALEVIPNSESLFQLGVVCEKLGLLEEANEHFHNYRCFGGGK